MHQWKYSIKSCHVFFQSTVPDGKGAKRNAQFPRTGLSFYFILIILYVGLVAVGSVSVCPDSTE